MGIFDIFGTSDQQAAAQAQIAGLNAANTAATGNINSGIGALTSNYGNAGAALTSNYTAALQPFLQNYSQAQTGVNGLYNLLGLNGAAGKQAALTSLENTPGYQFQLQQGNNAINAKAAATGSLDSGNTLLALSNYNQGLAGTTYQNAVNNLMPFLGQANAAASGIANTYTGLGSGLAGINTGLGTNLANTYTGLGNATASQYNTLAGLNYQTQTGIGNANANADLAGLTASGNIWNAIGSLGGAALGAVGGGGIGGGLGSLINTSLFGASPVSGAVGPTSVGGAPLSGGSLFGNIFSDERLKENIEPVGELYDGTGVYRYNYIGDNVARIGVMAQEVEQSRPDAITEFGGFKAVDYGKATDLAASLAKFVDDNVVKVDDRRSVKAGRNYASDLTRFLEAA